MNLPEIGSEFQGKYRIVDVLGEGGFARVYSAEDIGAKRSVALKILTPLEGGYQSATKARFDREVRTIGKLRDPHTVTLFDFGHTDDGLMFMVFEYVPGQDLATVIKQAGVLSPQATVHVLTQVLKSLREAHSHGLLHRDIKPQNIQISEYMGDPLRVTLLDFGIAKPVKPGPEMSAITHAGALVGTPQYMSPEQLLEQELTAASDIYSLGLVAYEMLVGEPAVAGNQLSDQLKILGGQSSLHLPPSAPIPLDLRRVVDRMISREQSNRMQSAEQVLRSLAALHLPGDDVSLDETGALAPVGSGTHVRHITGPQSPPTTGEQLASGGRVGHPGSSEQIPVYAPAYGAGSGQYSSGSLVHGDYSHSSAQVPLRSHASDGTTMIGPGEADDDELPTWALGIAALVIVIAVGGTVVALFGKMFDEPEATTPRQLPNLKPTDALPQSADGPENTVVARPIAAARTDGCGSEPALLGEVAMTITGDDALGVGKKVAVYLPQSYDPNRRHPLIVAFHDFPGGPWGVVRRSKLDKLADREGIVVLAVADEVEHFGGIWTSRRDIYRARTEVDEVIQNFCIDTSRIFGFGHGAGGKAVARLACEFEGIRATAASAFRPEKDSQRECDHGTPVPHINFDPLRNKGAPPDGKRPCGIEQPKVSLADYEGELRADGVCSKKSRTWLSHEHGTCTEWTCERAARVTCRVDGGREYPGTQPRSGLGVTRGCDGEPVDFPYTDTMWRFFNEVAPAKAPASAEGDMESAADGGE